MDINRVRKDVEDVFYGKKLKNLSKEPTPKKGKVNTIM